MLNLAITYGCVITAALLVAGVLLACTAARVLDTRR